MRNVYFSQNDSLVISSVSTYCLDYFFCQFNLNFQIDFVEESSIIKFTNTSIIFIINSYFMYIILGFLLGKA